MFRYYFFLISFIFFLTNSIAHEKIVYLDVDYILSNSNPGKNILKNLEQKNSENIKKLKERERLLREEEEKILGQKKILNSDAFNDKVKLFQQKIETYRKEKDLLQNEKIENGDGIAIDMTGASQKTTLAQYEILKKNGYDVTFLHAEVSKERSIKMNRKRGERGQRQLPDRVVDMTWESVNSNIPTYKELFGENFFTVNTETTPMGTIPKVVSEGLYNRLNANEVLNSPLPENNNNLTPDLQLSFSNVEKRAQQVKEIIDRNLSAKNRKPMSKAELRAAQKRLKFKVRFQPNSYSHLSLLNSRVFKYRQDYEKVEQLINGQFDRDESAYNNYKFKVIRYFLFIFNIIVVVFL